MDAESAEWVRALAGGGAERDAALARLRGRFVAIARYESHRRRAVPGVTGSELSDLAEQAADDALLAVLAKLPTFRGDSRFTTWAYRFVVLEVGHRVARHHWRHAVPADGTIWERLPAK